MMVAIGSRLFCSEKNRCAMIGRMHTAEGAVGLLSYCSEALDGFCFRRDCSAAAARATSEVRHVRGVGPSISSAGVREFLALCNRLRRAAERD
jgi:hypothetical protein